MADQEIKFKFTGDTGDLSRKLDGIAKSFGALVSVTAIVRSAFAALEAQAAQVDAINKLNLALANQGKFSEAASKALVNYSSALQDASTYADEVILSSEALFASFGMGEDQIKKSTQAALDFAAATGTDLNAATMLLGKAYAGNTAALGRYGIVVDDNLSKQQKFEAVVRQLEGRFGGSALAATQSFTGGLKQLHNATGDVQEAFGKFLGELAGSDRPFGAAIDGLKKITEFVSVDLILALSEARAMILEFLAVIVDSPRFFKGLLTTLELLGAPKSGLLHDLIDGGHDAAEALRAQATAIREEGDHAAMAAGKTQKFANSLHQVSVGANDATKSIKLMDGAVQEYFKHLDDQAMDVLKAPTRNMGNLGLFAPGNGGSGGRPSPMFDPNDKTLSESTKALIADAEKGAEKWQLWGDAIAEVAHQLGGTFGSIVASLGAVFDGLAFHERQAAENLKLYGDTAMTSAQKIQAGAQAANAAFDVYNQGKASKSPGKGALSGAGKGAAAGSAFGPYGMVIGAVVGAGIGFLGGKKGQAEELKQLNKQMDELMAKAKHAGVTLDHAFNPKSAKSLKQALLDLQEAMDMKPLQDEFNQLVVAARIAGIEFNKTFDTHNADALKNSIDEIKRALDTQAEAHQKVQEAMDRYGITADQMGAAWQKQELDKQAAQLYQDWQLLNAAGVDHTVLLEKMGPSVNEYVQAALKSGTEIPEAMKPIIEEMIEQHKLLDENGNAYGSVEEAGIKYGKTQSEMFDVLIQKVTDLVNALLGIPSEVNTDVNVNKRVTEDDGTVTGGDDEGGRRPIPHFARGGHVDPGDGRGGGKGGGGGGGGVHVIVAENEGETIVPDSQRGEYADAWGGGNEEIQNELTGLGDKIDRLADAIERGVKPGANITISPTIPVDSLGLSRNRADFFNEVEERAAQGIRLGTSAMFRALQDRGVV